MQRDDGARALWRAAYERLAEGQPGLLGALTARAEAQVLRLSLIYALLDCSPDIREPHLRAALALWDYAERSVKYIFGDALGDPVADTILTHLRAAGRAGLSRTDISGLFQRNVSAAKITPALMSLLKGQLASFKRVPSGGIRPTEMWYAVGKENV